MSINNKNAQKGFTLVEMAVVAPIVILVIGTFIYAIITMTGDVMAGRAANVLAYNIQDALNRIEADFKTSGGYLTDSIMPTTPQGHNDTADTFTKDTSTLIINSFATTKNPADSARSIVHQKQSGACNTSPMMINTVYFISNNTLWRRVIMPSDYTNTDNYCDSPWQQPSCSPGQTATICKTQDEKLVENLDSTDGFNVTYDSANKITITITATSKTAGRSITKSGTISAINLN